MIRGASAARRLTTPSRHRSIGGYGPWTTHRNPSTPVGRWSSTSSSTPDLIEELEQRGLIATLTSRALRTHLHTAPRTVYSGVDPSADSLHVGNLLPLLTLAHFARFNHNPIVLVGGATGSIGDPSGRSSERNALDKTTLEGNVEAIKGQLRKFFDNVQEWYRVEQGYSRRTAEEAGGVELGMGVRMMNNYDWMNNISLLDFLCSVGRHARLTHMLARESVASRLQPSPTSSSSSNGMSYTEFSYQLLQAYDFSFLHTNHSCTIQIGGSDQLGNITAGIDLIRRLQTLTTHHPAYGLTLPLLTTHTGEKFGKSAGNAVWLSPLKTSDWHFYQFFLRTTDQDVARYLRCLTLLTPHTVDEIIAQHATTPRSRLAQQTLASHMTHLIRGKQAAQKCQSLSHLLFSHTTTTNLVGSNDPVEAAKLALSKLDVAMLKEEGDDLLARLPRGQVVGADVAKLAVGAGLVKSRGEARRLWKSGG
ncbi:hypothetical protein, partial [Sporisorium scitamineum]